MRRLIVLALCATGGLFWSTPAHAALEVRLTVKPLSPLAGTRALIELRTYSPLIRADGSCCRLAPADPVGYPFRVEAVSPAGDMTRVRVRRARRSLWRGTFRFPTPGRWQVRVANYGPTYEHAPGARPRIWVRVRQRQATTPPSSFGPLGSPGCSPPSPRNRAGDNASRAEVFGTAVGGSFWGLFLFMPRG